jgi:hypothetical protein
MIHLSVSSLTNLKVPFTEFKKLQYAITENKTILVQPLHNAFLKVSTSSISFYRSEQRNHILTTAQQVTYNRFLSSRVKNNDLYRRYGRRDT